jgi:hypothetical protein
MRPPIAYAEKGHPKIRRGPDIVLNYSNLAAVFEDLERFKEGKATIDRTLARRLGGGQLRLIMYYLAFLLGDAAQMEQQVALGWG